MTPAEEAALYLGAKPKLDQRRGSAGDRDAAKGDDSRPQINDCEADRHRREDDPNAAGDGLRLGAPHA